MNKQRIRSIIKEMKRNYQAEKALSGASDIISILENCSTTGGCFRSFAVRASQLRIYLDINNDLFSEIVQEVESVSMLRIKLKKLINE